MKKSLISTLLVCAIVFSIGAFLRFAPNEFLNQKTPFASNLVDIYQKYDSGESGIESRLILSNYSSSNTYGAADWAIDEKHSFAVLQYENKEKAKQALEMIKKDGIEAEFDSKSEILGLEKGSVFPAGSNAIGSPSYISKFNMEKEDIIVAVIDTGVMYDHELMENRFVSRGYDFSDDGRNNAYYNTNMNDSVYAHGTMVCGIIADNTPDNVKILPYKAVPFGATEASNSAIVASIYDAVDKGASVINVSMSTTSGANAFKYAVETALKNNVCVCASAGNDGKEIKHRYPSATPGVITVSALESDMQSFASFSNYGTSVDFCAPGRKVVSACPYKSGGEKYASNSGTSFSAPFISAVCANIKSINSAFTKDEVYEIICDFSEDLGDEGYDIYYGNGLPNLGNMVYSDGETYTFNIPEGTLEITNNTCDYNAQTQPWHLFADKMLSVKVDDNVESLGAYAFYNMKKAVFDMPQSYKSIGTYAFYSCNDVKAMAFDENVVDIGENAFGGLSEDFYISGYRNTAAEVYSQRENISFVSLGCKHNYYADVIEPTDEAQGYTVYTCTVCGDSYIGDYIEPPEYYEGECGMGVYWRYSTREKTLEISGSGYMNAYSPENEAPWSHFMKKIKSVSIGENITFISDYILCNAQNAESLKIFSKTATLSEQTVVFDDESENRIVIFAYDDSVAKDYLSENDIEYFSLGCEHSRGMNYYEEQPSCCFDTFGVYSCVDCEYEYREYISLENKGHYFSGIVNTLDINAIFEAEVYVDGKLSAITNDKGKYAIYPVLCGTHSIEIKKNSKLIDSFVITVDKSNLKCSAQFCYGDFDSNGYINAKDYAFALKNGYSDSNILDYGKAEKSSFVNESYDVQELPYALEFENLPDDDSDKRIFTAVIENNSEFEIKESGFIYGKNMSDDMLCFEKVGAINGDGFAVKKVAASNNDAYEKTFKYGSSNGKGVISARFYIIYTNGVKDFTYYSSVSSYVYSD